MQRLPLVSVRSILGPDTAQHAAVPAPGAGAGFFLKRISPRILLQLLNKAVNLSHAYGQNLSGVEEGQAGYSPNLHHVSALTPAAPYESPCQAQQSRKQEQVGSSRAHCHRSSGAPQVPPDSPSGRGVVFRVGAERGRRNHDHDHLNSGVEVGDTATVDITLAHVPGDDSVCACYNASESWSQMTLTRAA